MAYDIYGPWSATAGPNAPLFHTCAPPAQQVGSADGAIKAWTNAGFPAAKVSYHLYSREGHVWLIVFMKLSLGIPAYGHSYIVNPVQALNASGEMNLYPPNGGTPKGDRWDDAPGLRLFTLQDIDPLKM